MNTDIEKLLRKPQGFTPPPGLKERLIEQIPARGSETNLRNATARPASGGWLRRWWPALVPGAASLACAVVLTVQQGEIRELKASNQALSEAATAAESNAARGNGLETATPAEPSAEMQQEINRLRELVAQLKTEIAQLQQLQTENGKLRAQVAAPPQLALTPEETESLAKAKEKALSIACINNLKQFGLAVRTWALDNNDSNPPNVLCMSNELSTPKVLFCPADTSRQAATDWSSFTMANCSYEFLVPNEKEADREPNRISVRCPIHGHIGMCDGSVQGNVGKNHPDWLVDRDGKLYLEMPPQPQPVSPTPQAAAPPPGMTQEQMEMYRRRYGILPDATAPNQNP